MKKVIVIGGGAAGFFASIHAAEMGAHVTIFEKGNHILAKVKVSGGGRCNVTTSTTNPQDLIQFYPRGSRELLGPFTRFNPEDTMEWFRDRGVELKTEDDGRVFPKSNNSQTIIDCLVTAANKAGVVVKMQSGITAINYNDHQFELEINGGNKISADAVIITTGGNPNLKGYDWLGNLGHTIIPPVPSLFTFNCTNSPLQDLMGISVQDTLVKIKESKFEQQGPLLITHWGLSGPAVLKLSSWAARWLYERKYQFIVTVNFLPDYTSIELDDIFRDFIKQNSTRKVATPVFKEIPSRLWERICKLSGVKENQNWADLNKITLTKMINALNNFELKVQGKTTFKEEFVTCGGIDLKEVNMKTMESKLIPGLFFAGEVLNIDGITGGYNFQAAWTTGWLAGNSVA